MKVLLDTNVILRCTNPSAPEHVAVVESIRGLISRGDTCCVCTQSIAELWAVLTRPIVANGYGLEPDDTRARVDTIFSTFTLLPDSPSLFAAWLDLCSSHQVRGRQVFDARIVAMMSTAGITRIVTLNPTDFTRYSMIEVIVPRMTLD